MACSPETCVRKSNEQGVKLLLAGSETDFVRTLGKGAGIRYPKYISNPDAASFWFILCACPTVDRLGTGSVGVRLREHLARGGDELIIDGLLDNNGFRMVNMPPPLFRGMRLACFWGHVPDGVGPQRAAHTRQRPRGSGGLRLHVPGVLRL